MTGDEQRKQIAVVVPGIFASEDFLNLLLHRLPVGILFLCECLDKARVDLALSFDLRNAACIRQPVGDFLFRSSKRKNQIGGFVFRDPFAYESLGFIYIYDI